MIQKSEKNKGTVVVSTFRLPKNSAFYSDFLLVGT